MFDDQTTSPGGAVPPNLPIGEPEDIFARVQPADDDAGDFGSPLPPDPSGLSTPIPDGLGSKTALSAGVLQPKQAGVPLTERSTGTLPESEPHRSQVPPSPPAPAPHPPAVSVTHTLPTDAPDMYNVQEPQRYAVKDPKTSRGIVTVIIVLVVLGILAGGVVFVYTKFMSDRPQSPDVPVDTDDEMGDRPTDTPLEEDVPESFDPIVIPDASGSSTMQDREGDILFGESVDTDADGLDDVRERGIGTDLAHWDTDGDGLSDGDEVIIWKTDPLNPDTDGDGYPDGDEVKNGYSPTGPGRIFEPPSGTVNTGGAT